MNLSNAFQLLLEDQNSVIVHDFSSLSSSMIIAFGGMKGALGIPVFEFFNLTSQYDTKKIYVRDLQQAWYHCGLPSKADSIDNIALILQQHIKDEGIRKTITIGNSMGGYAAILFGCLLCAYEVHAFSPQTFINPFLRFVYSDWRWQRQIGLVYKSNSSQPEYYDLKKVLHTKKCGDTVFNIYYSEADRLDRIHAVRMRKLPGVALHSYNLGGHGLVKHLRDTGLLSIALRRSLKEL